MAIPPCMRHPGTFERVPTDFRRTQMAFRRQRGYLLHTSKWVLGVALLKLPLLSGQAPDLQNDLKAAATAEESGRYDEAATLYQKILSGMDSSKADPSTVVHVRTRLATA